MVVLGHVLISSKIVLNLSIVDRETYQAGHTSHTCFYLHWMQDSFGASNSFHCGYSHSINCTQWHQTAICREMSFQC